MNAIQRFQECRQLAETGTPMTQDEARNFACQQAAKDAEAWNRIRPQPQLQLSEAA